MTFKDEADLRRWYKRHKKGAHFWFEAAMGSTHGVPDVLTVEDGRVYFFELKVGELVDGFVRFSMHNAQRIVLRQICEAGGNAFVLAAEKDGDRLWLAEGRKAVVVLSNRESDGVRGRVPHLIPATNEVDKESFS